MPADRAAQVDIKLAPGCEEEWNAAMTRMGAKAAVLANQLAEVLELAVPAAEAMQKIRVATHPNWHWQCASCGELEKRTHDVDLDVPPMIEPPIGHTHTWYLPTGAIPGQVEGVRTWRWKCAGCYENWTGPVGEWPNGPLK